MIKILICVIILLFVPFQYFSQTDDDSTKNALECDSIILNSGETLTCLIQKLEKRKIIYFLCCDVCAVPREIKMELIDTILLSAASRKRFYPDNLNSSLPDESVTESTDSLNVDTNIYAGHNNIKILMLKKRFGNQKTTLIKIGSHVKVVTKLNEVYKGKLSLGNNKEIYIGSKQLILTDIKTITKSSRAWKVAGGITGSTTTLTTLYLAAWGIPVLFIPVSATPFLLMLIKKEYDLVNDYEIYYLH